MYSQESAEKGPPRRAWQIHLSLSGLRRATQALLSCETSAGGIKSAGVCNSHKGITSSKWSLFFSSLFQIRQWDLSTVRGPKYPDSFREGEVCLCEIKESFIGIFVWRYLEIYFLKLINHKPCLNPNPEQM